MRRVVCGARILAAFNFHLAEPTFLCVCFLFECWSVCCSQTQFVGVTKICLRAFPPVDCVFIRFACFSSALFRRRFSARFEFFLSFFFVSLFALLKKLDTFSARNQLACAVAAAFARADFCVYCATTSASLRNATRCCCSFAVCFGAALVAVFGQNKQCSLSEQFAPICQRETFEVDCNRC